MKVKMTRKKPNGSNSEMINKRFDDIGKATGLVFDRVQPEDTIDEGTQRIVKNLDTLFRHIQTNAMTGQEWYDRFINNLPKMKQPDDNELSKKRDMSCYYCENHNNPFKMNYSPLWFAWCPVKTSSGICFLKYVHKIPHHGVQSNLVGSWPVTWYTYETCRS